MKQLKVEYQRNDERGSLTQISTGEWRQLNHLIIKKGHFLGGHYHKKKIELFYILSGIVVMEIIKDNKTEFTLLEEADCFLVEPYEIHILHAIRDSVLIEVLSEPFSEEDTIKYVT